VTGVAAGPVLGAASITTAVSWPGCSRDRVGSRNRHLRVADGLHHDRGVGRPSQLAVVAALVGGAGGCFYDGVINDRPSAEIHRVGSGVPARGDALQFQAVVDDPDGDRVETQWRAEACNENVVCTSIATGTDMVFGFRIPATAGGLPTVRVEVHLDVRDQVGAVARPPQSLSLDVINNPPDLTVQRRGRELAGRFPPGVPITVSAAASDPDGDAVTLSWVLYPAAGSVPGDRQWYRLPDPPTGGQEYLLVPDVDGDWTVEVTADDGLDQTVVQSLIRVAPDRPPCLGAIDPIAPPPGAALVLDQPRRFSVLVVDDDLDVYPAPPPDDPYLGVAGFRWYLREPGATGFTLVDTEVAALELDPAHYAPADQVEVRVEIDDRVGRTLPCAADAPTCSLGQDACLQRRTWTVEVR